MGRGRAGIRETGRRPTRVEVWQTGSGSATALSGSPGSTWRSSVSATPSPGRRTGRTSSSTPRRRSPTSADSGCSQSTSTPPLPRRPAPHALPRPVLLPALTQGSRLSVQETSPVSVHLFTHSCLSPSTADPFPEVSYPVHIPSPPRHIHYVGTFLPTRAPPPRPVPVFPPRTCFPPRSPLPLSWTSLEPPFFYLPSPPRISDYPTSHPLPPSQTLSDSPSSNPGSPRPHVPPTHRWPRGTRGWSSSPTRAPTTSAGSATTFSSTSDGLSRRGPTCSGSRSWTTTLGPTRSGYAIPSVSLG